MHVARTILGSTPACYIDGAQMECRLFSLVVLRDECYIYKLFYII